MKSKEQIEARLSDCQAEYENLKEWHEKAYQKYLDDKKWWGSEADRGEYDYTGDLMNELIKEIKLLEWVLKNESKRILYRRVIRRTSNSGICYRRIRKLFTTDCY